ncbi:EndoU domain-containing protein, partial [Kitasatospora sp. NE20-6]|uniref:EndoU domain-containing protein n=1 Tax=Kitasatospora sp. NE20-6 TaxID=2859066 RepID=UPI0038B3578E
PVQDWAGYAAEFMGAGREGLEEVAARVEAAGAGAAAIVFGAGRNGSGHIWNLVNVPGTGLVWVDAQRSVWAPGEQPLYPDATRIWAIPLDADNTYIPGTGHWNDATTTHTHTHNATDNTSTAQPPATFTGAVLGLLGPGERLLAQAQVERPSERSVRELGTSGPFHERRFEAGRVRLANGDIETRAVVRIFLDMQLAGHGPIALKLIGDLEQRARDGVAARYNQGSRLPNGDVLNVAVEFVRRQTDAHHTVLVHPDVIRENFMNWSVESHRDAIAHEIGHLLGLHDEYREVGGEIRPVYTDGALMAGFTVDGRGRPVVDNDRAVVGWGLGRMRIAPRHLRQLGAWIGTALDGAGGRDLVRADGRPSRASFSLDVRRAVLYGKAGVGGLLLPSGMSGRVRPVPVGVANANGTFRAEYPADAVDATTRETLAHPVVGDLSVTLLPRTDTRSQVMFPAHWTEDDAVYAAEQAYLDALRNDGVWPLGASTDAFRWRGVYGGVRIEGELHRGEFTSFRPAADQQGLTIPPYLPEAVQVAGQGPRFGQRVEDLARYGNRRTRTGVHINLGAAETMQAGLWIEAQGEVHANGTYGALVWFLDPAVPWISAMARFPSRWRLHRDGDRHRMFPKDWTPDEVLDAVEGACRNGGKRFSSDGRTEYWVGVARGVRIEALVRDGQYLAYRPTWDQSRGFRRGGLRAPEPAEIDAKRQWLTGRRALSEPDPTDSGGFDMPVRTRLDDGYRDSIAARFAPGAPRSAGDFPREWTEEEVRLAAYWVERSPKETRTDPSRPESRIMQGHFAGVVVEVVVEDGMIVDFYPAPGQDFSASGIVSVPQETVGFSPGDRRDAARGSRAVGRGGSAEHKRRARQDGRSVVTDAGRTARTVPEAQHGEKAPRRHAPEVAPGKPPALTRWATDGERDAVLWAWRPPKPGEKVRQNFRQYMAVRYPGFGGRGDFETSDRMLERTMAHVLREYYGRDNQEIARALGRSHHWPSAIWELPSYPLPPGPLRETILAWRPSGTETFTQFLRARYDRGFLLPHPVYKYVGGLLSRSDKALMEEMAVILRTAMPHASAEDVVGYLGEGLFAADIKAAWKAADSSENSGRSLPPTAERLPGSLADPPTQHGERDEEGFGEPGALVAVAGDGLCLLHAVIASDPEAVAQALVECEPALRGPGERPWPVPTVEALRRAVARYLLDTGPQNLSASVAWNYRNVRTESLRAEIGGLSREQLLNSLRQLGVDHLTDHNLAPVRLLRARFLEAGGEESLVKWKFQDEATRAAAEDYLRARGEEPLPDAHEMRDQYIRVRAQEFVDVGGGFLDVEQAREHVGQGVGWNLADDAQSPRQLLDYLHARHMGIFVDELPTGTLVDMLVARQITSDGPLTDEEFRELRDAVDRWEEAWSTATGEVFPLLLPEALGLRLRIVRALPDGRVSTVQVYGPAGGRPVTVYHNGVNHYDASAPAPRPVERTPAPSGALRAAHAHLYLPAPPPVVPPDHPARAADYFQRVPRQLDEHKISSTGWHTVNGRRFRLAPVLHWGRTVELHREGPVVHFRDRDTKEVLFWQELDEPEELFTAPPSGERVQGLKTRVPPAPDDGVLEDGIWHGRLTGGIGERRILLFRTGHDARNALDEAAEHELPYDRYGPVSTARRTVKKPMSDGPMLHLNTRQVDLLAAVLAERGITGPDDLGAAVEMVAADLAGTKGWRDYAKMFSWNISLLGRLRTAWLEPGPDSVILWNVFREKLPVLPELSPARPKASSGPSPREANERRGLAKTAASREVAARQGTTAADGRHDDLAQTGVVSAGPAHTASGPPPAVPRRSRVAYTTDASGQRVPIGRQNPGAGRGEGEFEAMPGVARREGEGPLGAPGDSGRETVTWTGTDEAVAPTGGGEEQAFARKRLAEPYPEGGQTAKRTRGPGDGLLDEDGDIRMSSPGVGLLGEPTGSGAVGGFGDDPPGATWMWPFPLEGSEDFLTSGIGAEDPERDFEDWTSPPGGIGTLAGTLPTADALWIFDHTSGAVGHLGIARETTTGTGLSGVPTRSSSAMPDVVSELVPTSEPSGQSGFSSVPPGAPALYEPDRVEPGLTAEELPSGLEDVWGLLDMFDEEGQVGAGYESGGGFGAIHGGEERHQLADGGQDWDLGPVPEAHSGPIHGDPLVLEAWYGEPSGVLPLPPRPAAEGATHGEGGPVELPDDLAWPRPPGRGGVEEVDFVAGVGRSSLATVTPRGKSGSFVLGAVQFQHAPVRFRRVPLQWVRRGYEVTFWKKGTSSEVDSFTKTISGPEVEGDTVEPRADVTGLGAVRLTAPDVPEGHALPDGKWHWRMAGKRGYRELWFYESEEAANAGGEPTEKLPYDLPRTSLLLPPGSWATCGSSFLLRLEETERWAPVGELLEAGFIRGIGRSSVAALTPPVVSGSFRIGGVQFHKTPDRFRGVRLQWVRLGYEVTFWKEGTIREADSFTMTFSDAEFVSGTVRPGTAITGFSAVRLTAPDAPEGDALFGGMWHVRRVGRPGERELWFYGSEEAANAGGEPTEKLPYDLPKGSGTSPPGTRLAFPAVPPPPGRGGVEEVDFVAGVGRSSLTTVTPSAKSGSFVLGPVHFQRTPGRFCGVPLRWVRQGDEVTFWKDGTSSEADSFTKTISGPEVEGDTVEPRANVTRLGTARLTAPDAPEGHALPDGKWHWRMAGKRGHRELWFYESEEAANAGGEPTDKRPYDLPRTSLLLPPGSWETCGSSFRLRLEETERWAPVGELLEAGFIRGIGRSSVASLISPVGSGSFRIGPVQFHKTPDRFRGVPLQWVRLGYEVTFWKEGNSREADSFTMTFSDAEFVSDTVRPGTAITGFSAVRLTAPDAPEGDALFGGMWHVRRVGRPGERELWFYGSEEAANAEGE